MNLLNVTKRLTPLNKSIENAIFWQTDGKAARNVQRGTAVKCIPVLQIHTGHNAGK